MFIRLNYTKDFKVKRGKSYRPSSAWVLMDENYHFTSEGVVGYKVIKDADIYTEVKEIVTTKSWFRGTTNKEVITRKYLGVKTLYRYYRVQEGIIGVPDFLSTFTLDTLVLGETND